MSDYQSSSNAGSPVGSQGAGASRKAGEYADALKGQVADVADEAKQRAADLTEKAKGVALEAADKLKDATEQQKNAGAEFASGFAGAIRRAANEFDNYVPEAGKYIRLAADQIDEASDAIRQRDLNQLVSGVKDFAKNQPTAFLGVAVLAGFAAVRLLKGSGAASAVSSAATSMASHGDESRLRNQGAGTGNFNSTTPPRQTSYSAPKATI